MSQSRVESSPVMSNPVRNTTWKCLFSFVRPKHHIFLWCRDDGHRISEGMIVTKAVHNPDLVVSVTAFSLCSKSHFMNLELDYCKAVYFRRVQIFTYYRKNVFLLNNQSTLQGIKNRIHFCRYIIKKKLQILHLFLIKLPV